MSCFGCGCGGLESWGLGTGGRELVDRRGKEGTYFGPLQMSVEFSVFCCLFSLCLSDGSRPRALGNDLFDVFIARSVKRAGK